MNREQLEVLFKAGLISQATYAASLTALSANGTCVPPRFDLQVTTGGIRLEVEGDEDSPTGGILRADIVTRYDAEIESHGMVIHAGALEPREPLTRSKLLRDHDHAQPVGYMLEVDAKRQSAAWQIASTEIAKVKQEVDEHLRDGLSVGFTVLEYTIDPDWVLHVHRADWYETSLCAIPAVQEAGVSSVAAALATARKEHSIMNRAQLAAALKAGTITQEQHDAAIKAIEAHELANGPAPVVPVQPEVEAGPQLQTQQPAPHAVVSNESLSLDAVVRRLSDAVNTGDRSAVALAISDIVPADDAGTAFLARDDWQGELFTANDPRRPWIDAWGTPGPLTSIKGKGWRWTDEPDVEEYAGNKTEVASNEIGTESAEFTAFRVAAGWDVDRIFEDLADAEFWGPFWAAVIRSYIRKSNARARIRVIGGLIPNATGTGTVELPPAALAPGDTVGGSETVSTGGVVALLKQIIRDGRAVEGGRINRIFLADDMFGELEDLDTGVGSTLPLWLKNAVLNMNIAEGTADVGTLRIEADGTLVDGKVVGFDSRAAVWREKAPFQVQAINVANGGIDVGIFSYLRFEPNDPRLIITRTYGEELPVAP